MTHSRSSFGSSHLLFARPCLFATKANSTPIIQAVHLRQCATPEPGIEMTVSATLDLINPRSRECTKPSAFGFRKKEKKKRKGEKTNSLGKPYAGFQTWHIHAWFVPTSSSFLSTLPSHPLLLPRTCLGALHTIEKKTPLVLVPNCYIPSFRMWSRTRNKVEPTKKKKNHVLHDCNVGQKRGRVDLGACIIFEIVLLHGVYLIT